MYIYYDHSVVTGTSQDGGQATEDMIHMRGQDPILLAARRNNKMAGMESFRVESRGAFQRWLDIPETKHRRDIPRAAGTAEEWDW